MGNCLTSPSIASPPCSPSPSSSASSSSSLPLSSSSSSCSSDKAHPYLPSKRPRSPPFRILPPSPLILPFPTPCDLLSLYRLGPKIGRGQFGVIRRCIEKSSSFEFACKSISKLRLFSQKEVAAVVAEVQTMQLLSGHPNIVQLHEVVEDNNYVHIIMELCKGGELFGRLEQKGCFGEEEAADVMKRLMEIVLYCHGKGVMHRDLKPENILLLENGAYSSSAIKLADFGQALCFTPGQKFSGMAGSAYYMAPEVLQEYQQYGEEVDVWSAGVILYILLSGVPPFWAETDEGIFKAIKEGKPDMVSKPWNNISPSAKDLIVRMLCSDANARFTPSKVLEHPWIQYTSFATTNVPEAEAISHHQDQDTLAASTGTESAAVDLSDFASALLSTMSSSNGLSVLASSARASAIPDPDKGSEPCPNSVSKPHSRPQNASLQLQSKDSLCTVSPGSHCPALREIHRNGVSKHSFDDLLKSLISKLENKILSLFPAMTKINLLQDEWCCSCTLLTSTASEQTLLIELGQERYLIGHDRTRKRIGWKLLTQTNSSSCTAQAPLVLQSPFMEVS